MFSLLILLVAFLWFWHAGKSWLSNLSLREIAARLKSRMVTVTPSSAIVIQRLQALNRLETAKMVSQHIVEASSKSTWLPSFLAGERLLLLAQVEVVAGVDLSKVLKSDIDVIGDKVAIVLPEPQILSARIDEAMTKVFAREKGWLVFNPDKNLERQARLQALSEARQAALQSGLMNFARKKAEESLRNFLHALGFKQVEIRWQTQREMKKEGEQGNG